MRRQREVPRIAITVSYNQPNEAMFWQIALEEAYQDDIERIGLSYLQAGKLTETIHRTLKEQYSELPWWP